MLSFYVSSVHCGAKWDFVVKCGLSYHIRWHRAPMFGPPKLRRFLSSLLASKLGLMWTLMLQPRFESKELSADSDLRSRKMQLTFLVVDSQ